MEIIHALDASSEYRKQNEAKKPVSKNSTAESQSLSKHIRQRILLINEPEPEPELKLTVCKNI